MTALQEHRMNAIEALEQLITYYQSDENLRKLVEQVVDELEARVLLMVAARVREARGNSDTFAGYTLDAIADALEGK